MSNCGEALHEACSVPDAIPPTSGYLFPTNKVRVGDVPLHNVRLHCRIVRFPPVVGSPVTNLAKLLEQEDTLALGLSCWLHNPCGPAVTLELLHKQRVVTRKHEGHGAKIVARGFVSPGEENNRSTYIRCCAVVPRLRRLHKLHHNATHRPSFSNALRMRLTFLIKRSLRQS